MFDILPFPNITSTEPKEQIAQMNNYIQQYPDHKLYILGNYSYLIKLSLDIPINKYDLINNGNMGYEGSAKYIKEIDQACSIEKCLFIINSAELNAQEYNQTNTDILLFVTKKYQQIYTSDAQIFEVYIN